MAKESLEIRGIRAELSTSPSELEKLAEEIALEEVDIDPYNFKRRNEFSSVRVAITENANTPIELLEKLAEDENGGVVRVAVAVNINTPITLLEKLAGDEDSDVRCGIAQNKNTPIPVLEKLAEDKDGGVREQVAGNVNAPMPLLEKLVQMELRKL